MLFDDDVRSYLTDEDRQEIAEEFYAKGIEQGEAKGKAEMAIALKNLDVPVEQIAKASGLSVEEVEAL
ncbi:MAG: hypothetical protein J5737_05125 [Bacteroidales bacterium]|nr:hypothetical protein [Bacteroidales bacterium]